ncbi:hypothetical protein DQP55_14315 [Mycolicibacterium sp. GF69]|nr:hypothetical protein DQP55_14315 [Mycolicibacterium sp. GF69]
MTGSTGGAFFAGAFFAGAAFLAAFFAGAFLAGAFLAAFFAGAFLAAFFAGFFAAGGAGGAGGSGTGGTRGSAEVPADSAAAGCGVDSSAGGEPCGCSSGRPCWSAIGLLLCSISSPPGSSCQVGCCALTGDGQSGRQRHGDDHQRGLHARPGP